MNYHKGVYSEARVIIIIHSREFPWQDGHRHRAGIMGGCLSNDLQDD